MQLRRLAAGFGLLALAGWAAGGSTAAAMGLPFHPTLVYNVHVHKMIPEQELRYASAGGRHVRVELHGTAFGADRSAFDAAVIAHMQGATRFQPVRFADKPREEDRIGYRVALSFDSADAAGFNLCNEDHRYRPAPRAGLVRVNAAFCLWDVLISSASGRVGGAQDPEDPRFRQLVRDVVRHLFPVRHR